MAPITLSFAGDRMPLHVGKDGRARGYEYCSFQYL
jgi:hypothetical protein